MAFVAMRPMTAWGEGGSVSLAPGELVPGFLQLKASVRQALLRSMYVQDTESPKLVPTIANGKMSMQAPTWAPTDESYTGPSTELLTCPHCEHPGFATPAGRRKHLKSRHAS